jgi:hypothetical protein
VASVAAEVSRQAGFRPRIVQEATETSTAIALVAAGLGLCVMPDSSALPMSASITTRPLDPAVTIGLATAWRAGDDSPLVAAFVDLVREAANGLRSPERDGLRSPAPDSPGAPDSPDAPNSPESPDASHAPTTQPPEDS